MISTCWNVNHDDHSGDETCRGAIIALQVYRLREFVLNGGIGGGTLLDHCDQGELVELACRLARVVKRVENSGMLKDMADDGSEYDEIVNNLIAAAGVVRQHDNTFSVGQTHIPRHEVLEYLQQQMNDLVALIGII